ncbi:MAG: hypothetical protein ABIH46_08245 [Chloroflexota bacterium]
MGFWCRERREAVAREGSLGKSGWSRILLLLLVLPFAIGDVISVGADMSSSAEKVGVGSRFGIAFINGPGYNVPEARYQQATDAGAKWTRWPMYWHEIETTPGKLGNDAYREQDKVVSRDVAHGLSINAILLGTPGWAATSGFSAAPMPRVAKADPSGPQTFGPHAPSSAISPPSNLYAPTFKADGTINHENYWARFVFSTVSRYRDRIKVWEMWNEPDLKLKEVEPVFWSGSDKDYYQLLKVGYQAAKAADPSCTVLFSGLAFWTDQQFFSRLLTLCKSDPSAAASNYYFDVLPLHFYVSPYHLYSFPAQFRAEMVAKLGVAKPIWVNETNIPLCGDTVVDPDLHCPARWHGNMEEQAAFIIQAYALGAAAGVERIFVFQLYDDAVGEHEWYGLIRNNGSPRPSYQAYKTASRYLSNVSSATLNSKGKVEKVTLYKAPDTKVTVIWNNSPSAISASVVLTGHSCIVMDKFGVQRPVSPQKGILSVALPGATYKDPISGYYDLGGDPYILVEKGYFPEKRLYLPQVSKAGPAVP